ncbi:hypothetical protein OH492_03270 [Vibrio chagasii]|nr:hypothetical protein [Vibrio chagasii]
MAYLKYDLAMTCGVKGSLMHPQITGRGTSVDGIQVPKGDVTPIDVKVAAADLDFNGCKAPSQRWRSGKHQMVGRIIEGFGEGGKIFKAWHSNVRVFADELMVVVTYGQGLRSFLI